MLWTCRDSCTGRKLKCCCKQGPCTSDSSEDGEDRYYRMQGNDDPNSKKTLPARCCKKVKLWFGNKGAAVTNAMLNTVGLEAADCAGLFSSYRYEDPYGCMSSSTTS